MSNSPKPGELFSRALVPDGTLVLNERCVIRTKDKQRVVVVAGIPLAHYAIGDRMAEAYAMVCLVEQGWVDQNDVANALGHTARTLRRYQRRFEEGGLPALGRSGGYTRGRARPPASRLRRLQQFKLQGLSNCQIAQRLGVTEAAIRKQLKRLGCKSATGAPPQLPFPSEGSNPNLSAFSTPLPAASADRGVPGAHPNLSAFPTEDPPLTLDRDPMNRCLDRLFACVGLLDDAAPLFESHERVTQAGLLLAVPFLLGSGVLDCARRIYGTIGPAFYGLRTTFVTLVLMALLRIRRPEGLKERAPQDLGRVLGLDRAPEVKTVRRKLTRLAAVGRARPTARCRRRRDGRATDLGRPPAPRRLADRGTA